VKRAKTWAELHGIVRRAVIRELGELAVIHDAQGWLGLGEGMRAAAKELRRAARKGGKR
jgi:hypothetical protein